jgi:uncharacterized protein (UPF0548 family)
MPEPMSVDDLLLARLAEIERMAPTVDLAKRDSYVAAAGWQVDAREIQLPGEPPGVPLPDASFAIACRILSDYSFPPARLIRGRFDPRVPLEQRAMLLTATYLWMRFELPVRVSRVLDETRDGAGGREQVWGYSYQTLAGHIERGEISFEIIKTVATGLVRFRIHSFSQTGHIANLIHRLGFRFVGRRLQARFAVESLRNMQRLVSGALATRAATAEGTTGAPGGGMKP